MNPKLPHLSLFVANVLVGVIVMSLMAARNAKIREAEQARVKSVESAPDIVQSGGAEIRRKRSLTPGEDGHLVDVLNKTIEEVLNGSRLQSTESPKGEKDVYTLSRCKPVAHLTGISMDFHDKSDKDVVEVTGWKKSGDREILRNGFKVRGGRLIVPIRGTYKFYFYFNFQTRNDSDSVPFEVQVHHMDAATFTERSLWAQSHGQGNGIKGRSAISNLRENNVYMQVVHHCEPLDEVFLKVKFLSALRENSEWHYFGAHIL